MNLPVILILFCIDYSLVREIVNYLIDRENLVLRNKSRHKNIQHSRTIKYLTISRTKNILYKKGAELRVDSPRVLQFAIG